MVNSIKSFFFLKIKQSYVHVTSRLETLRSPGEIPSVAALAAVPVLIGQTRSGGRGVGTLFLGYSPEMKHIY